MHTRPSPYLYFASGEFKNRVFSFNNKTGEVSNFRDECFDVDYIVVFVRKDLYTLFQLTCEKYANFSDTEHLEMTGVASIPSEEIQFNYRAANLDNKSLIVTGGRFGDRVGRFPGPVPAANCWKMDVKSENW